MNWGQRRRITILLILLGCFLLFVFIPYQIAHYEAPTCTDGKQNQDELGVDCGGVCTLACASMVTDLRVIWTKIFMVRDGVYDIVANLENPNLDTAAPKIPYVVRLYDGEGQVIAERRGQTFARPSERFIVFEGGLSTGGKTPSRGEISFEEQFKWGRVQVPNLDLRVIDKQLTNTSRSPRLTANLVNEGQRDERDISVTAIIYDNDNNPIGASATRVEKVAHGDKAKLSFTWTKPFSYQTEYESCEQPVDVILALDRSGSMSSDGKNPPQPLTDAKNAAVSFVDRLTGQDQVAYVSFATDASNPIDETLTDEFTKIKSIISSTAIKTGSIQYTNIGDALLRAREEFLTRRHTETSKAVVVLLTDGAPTYPKDPSDPKYPEQYARSVADRLKQDGVAIYTIGLGTDLNETLLRELASKPEQYYAAATGADLAGVYQEIATAICEKSPSVIEVVPRMNNVPTSF